jgi:hypothetical protein
VLFFSGLSICPGQLALLQFELFFLPLARSVL